MPPKGQGRGRGAPRRGRDAGISVGPAPGSSHVAAHITTIGVRRPNFGTSGRPITVYANAFETPLPTSIIHHYDVVIESSKPLPVRFTNDIIKQLQTSTAPEIFNPKGVYDGRKNMFFTHELPFGPNHSREFSVTLTNGGTNPNRAPPVYKVTLTRVQEINPEVLARYIDGQQSHDNVVLTAITALNVAVRMKPNQCYPFNVRSFFTEREMRNLGSGIEIWRGYFQSVRPALGRMLVNVDISTGYMYKRGPLISLCLEFFGKNDANALSPRRGLPDRDRLRLQRFLANLRITTSHTGNHTPITRVIKKLSTQGARDITFDRKVGGPITVAEYFRTTVAPLRYPDLLCVEVGKGALIPLELCIVPPGQIMRKQIPKDKTKDVLDFSTMKPQDRFNSIRNGFETLSYANNEYLQAFGMTGISQTPVEARARVLPVTKLKYSPQSKQEVTIPAFGAWNLVDKKFYRPRNIEAWAIVIYESERRFGSQAVTNLVDGLKTACRAVGMPITDAPPVVRWENGQGNVGQQLRIAGQAVVQSQGKGPNLLVVVLPDGGDDIYTAVKHFGDITQGIATQCLVSSKCFRAKQQYFANVCLKINVKLGGINAIPDPASSGLGDPLNPTIILGADVIHPAPGSNDRPSFASLVGSVDSNAAKYVAETQIQPGRVEMIQGLKEMARNIIALNLGYRETMEKVNKNLIAPKRIILYRDGVSEGEFAQVLAQEVPQIQEACKELNIRPKITVIVVGKRHHIRFNAKNPKDQDRSGNCPAGMVVDQDVSHPTEFDFYLLSHGGLLGTSRPSHYTVLYDENQFNADTIQSLSFALCHVYARATRSVSIPAPVYYADIVCARAKNHYDPAEGLNLSDTATESTAPRDPAVPDVFKKAFKSLHRAQRTLMYFS